MILLDHQALNIFTDGSSFDAPLRGGIGIRYVVVDQLGRAVNTCDLSPPGYELGIPTQMEIQAATRALALLREPGPPIEIGQFKRVNLFTDSAKLAEGFRLYRHTTGADPFYTDDEGSTIAHAKLWLALLRAARAVRKPVEITWVRGTDAGPHHDAAHDLARQSANGDLLPPLEPLDIEDSRELREIDAPPSWVHR